MANNRKPLAIVDGARVDVDGTEVLLIRVPLNCESPEQENVLTLQMGFFAFPFALVSERADGKLEIAGKGPWPEKLASKTHLDITWTKIPIYAPDSWGQFFVP